MGLNALKSWSLSGLRSNWLPFACGVFLALGAYLLYLDVRSLLDAEKQNLSTISKTLAHLATNPNFASSARTKDSKTQDDSQLNEMLQAVKTDFTFPGELMIIGWNEERAFYLASTTDHHQKGSPLDARLREDVKRAFHDNMVVRTQNYAISPLRTPDGLPIALVVAKLNSSQSFFRLFRFLIHYFILGLGLLAFLLISQRKNFAPTQSLKDSQDGIISLDQKGKILEMNTSAAQLLNTSPQSLRLKSFLTPQPHYFSFIPLNLRSPNEILEKNTHGKAKILKKDGSSIYVSFSSTLIKNNQEIMGSLIILRDITDDYLNEKNLSASKLNLEEKLIRDGLTGCLNKNFLSHFLNEQNLAWIKNDRYCLLIMDIDHFKSINDQEGHLKGDQILSQFGQYLVKFFRKTDRIIRYGGDEFCILLPQTDTATAEQISENFIRSLKKETSLDITVSIGISKIFAEDSVDSWFERADKALYEAKAKGRDGFIMAKTPELEILD